MGLAAARALALSLDIPAAGVSTLAALAAGRARGAAADRREAARALPRAGRRGRRAARRPRSRRRDACASATARCATASTSRRTGAEVPPDDSELHLPRARFHALLARDFGPADELSSPSTCARRRRSDARVKTAVDIRALTLARPERDRGDRAPLVRRRRGRVRCSRASSRSRRRSASARSRASSSAAT